jgi:Tol biopolymer transport system component
MRIALVSTLALVATTPALAAPPTVLAPDVISGPAHDSAPAFTPDDTTVYFTRGTPAASTILVSHRDGKTWSAPVVAPFSGEWSDMEPAMAPDGSFLIFVSNRPAHTGGAAIDGHWNGRDFPHDGGNLWRVDRKRDGWSAPVRLPDTINRGTSVFAPSVVRDGSIYFMTVDADGKHFHLYRAQRAGDTYDVPVPVSFGEPTANDVDPAVAPDESYAVFASNRAPATDLDLFLVRRRADGAWGKPEPLGTEINGPGSDVEARLSPDGKTLFFSSERVLPIAFPRTRTEAARDLARASWDNGNSNIWQVDLTPLLTK